MVTLYRGPNWKISVYGREHGIPHFHVTGREFRCAIAIGSLELLAGEAPPAALAIARAWATSNEDALIAKWKELNP